MPWLRALPLLALLAGVGCQKNTITLETDPGSNDSADDEPTGTTYGPATTDVTGTVDTTTGVTPGGPATYVLAIDTVIAPGIPLFAAVTTTPGIDTVDLTLQFLTASIPHQPVDAIYPYAGVPVDGTGTFYWDTGVILVPAAANAITGSDLVVSIQTNVVPVVPGPPAYCGPLGGTVLDPIQAPLDGSTHAMTQVPDLGNIPELLLSNCP